MKDISEKLPTRWAVRVPDDYQEKEVYAEYIIKYLLDVLKIPADYIVGSMRFYGHLSDEVGAFKSLFVGLDEKDLIKNNVTEISIDEFIDMVTDKKPSKKTAVKSSSNATVVNIGGPCELILKEGLTITRIGIRLFVEYLPNVKAQA